MGTHEPRPRPERWLWRLVSASELCEAAETLHLCSLMELAWLSHECEQHNDDVTMCAISEEMEKRPDRYDFLQHYRSLWPKHAKARGYDGANTEMTHTGHPQPPTK